MSLVSSVGLGPILKKNSYPPSKEAEIIRHLSLYKRGRWIYPGVLKRELKISIDDSYRILQGLSDNSLLESWYEVRCGNCQHIVLLVQCFNELPDTIECDCCGSIMNTLDNTIKIYKVL